jgi:hypothetical protein
MKNPRYSTGPTSPRGRAAAARKKMEQAEKYAPGMSLDMPDEVKKMAKGGMATSASRRADGIAKKGKTRCKMV